MKADLKYISLKNCISEVARNQAVLVDVREPAEFFDGHLNGAINIPSSTLKINQFEKWQDKKICLVCQSGNRVKWVANTLLENGIKEVFILQKQMEQITVESNSNRWSVDRQFRFFLGIMIALFLVGVNFLSSYFYIIPIILCSGLIITSIIDKCYLRIGIAKMPWNREDTIIY